jgi:hypothetical protein
MLQAIAMRADVADIKTALQSSRTLHRALFHNEPLWQRLLERDFGVDARSARAFADWHQRGGPGGLVRVHSLLSELHPQHGEHPGRVVADMSRPAHAEAVRSLLCARHTTELGLHAPPGSYAWVPIWRFRALRSLQIGSGFDLSASDNADVRLPDAPGLQRLHVHLRPAAAFPTLAMHSTVFRALASYSELRELSLHSLFTVDPVRQELLGPRPARRRARALVAAVREMWESTFSAVRLPALCRFQLSDPRCEHFDRNMQLQLLQAARATRVFSIERNRVDGPSGAEQPLELAPSSNVAPEMRVVYHIDVPPLGAEPTADGRWHQSLQSALRANAHAHTVVLTAPVVDLALRERPAETNADLRDLEKLTPHTRLDIQPVAGHSTPSLPTAWVLYNLRSLVRSPPSTDEHQVLPLLGATQLGGAVFDRLLVGHSAVDGRTEIDAVAQLDGARRPIGVVYPRHEALHLQLSGIWPVAGCPCAAERGRVCRMCREAGDALQNGVADVLADLAWLASARPPRRQ